MGKGKPTVSSLLSEEYLRSDDVDTDMLGGLYAAAGKVPEQKPAQPEANKQAEASPEEAGIDLALRNINPYRYKFYDDPEKNKQAQEFVKDYQDISRTQGLEGALEKAVTKWNAKHQEIEDVIDVSYIKSCVGDQTKAATKKEYYAAMAEHAPDATTRAQYAAKEKFQLTDTKIDVSRDAIDPEKSALKNLDPIKYNFYPDDPERNKNARAYIDIYKEVSKATDHDAALTESLVKKAWVERYGKPDGVIKKNSEYDIDIEHIKKCISDPTKAVSRSEYYSEVAAQSPPVGRIVFSAVAKAIPEGKVDVTKDYKQVDVNESTIERLSKVNVDIPVIGKVNAGKILKGAAIAGSVAVAAASIAASGGAALPIVIPILSATCSATGMAAGILSSTHDELKEKEDTRKFLSDAIEVQNAANIDGKTPNPAAHEKAEKLINNIIGDSIDRAVDLHKNGRNISGGEWAEFAVGAGLSVASIATGGLSEVITGTAKASVEGVNMGLSAGIIVNSARLFISENIEQTQKNNTQKERTAQYAVELTELNKTLGEPVKLDKKVTDLHETVLRRQSFAENGVLNLSSLIEGGSFGELVSSRGSFTSNDSIATQAAGRQGSAPSFDEDDFMLGPVKTLASLQRVGTQPKLLDLDDDLLGSPITVNPLAVLKGARDSSDRSTSASSAVETAAAKKPQMGILNIEAVTKQAESTKMPVRSKAADEMLL